MTFGDVRMTQGEFDSLLEYSNSLPTGQTIGKRWKRHLRGDQWLLGEYVTGDDIGYVSVSWRYIKIGEPDSAHLLLKHRNGDKCIWDGDTWFVPLDAGGEGYVCENPEHDEIRGKDRR